MYHWCMAAKELSIIYKVHLLNAGNIKEHEGRFYHVCGKLKKKWIQVHIMMQRILNINIKMKPEHFLLELMDNQSEKTYGKLILYILLKKDYSMHNDRERLKYPQWRNGLWRWQN